MIAFDTNVLIHAHRVDSPFYPRAVEAVSAAANSQQAWAIPWPCVDEFLAVSTHPRIFNTPSPPEAALEQVEAWLESPSLNLLSEDNGYFRGFSDLVRNGAVRGPKVHDARIAALCLFFGVSVLYTADRDFSRFPALKTKNPLVAR
ncbi:MAG: TA system VapC family ribonuclease toxin [Myxococcota bacterium]